MASVNTSHYVGRLTLAKVEPHEGHRGEVLYSLLLEFQGGPGGDYLLIPGLTSAELAAIGRACLRAEPVLARDCAGVPA